MTEQPTLHDLRRRLARLGRLRNAVRWLSALSTSITWLLWLLAGLLVIDVLFELDLLQRVTSILLAAAAYAWVLLTRVRPYFGYHETEIDLALLIERLHNIDTDLVAAIEFTRPAAKSWGSPTLRGKVIDDVAARERHLDISGGIDRREPMRRVRNLILTLACTLVTTLLFPQHVTVFLQRLAWGDAHYPSHTVLESIEVNGQRVFPVDNRHTPRLARSAERQPVEFMVHCPRGAPHEGELRIATVSGTGQRTVRLTRREPPTGGVPDTAVFEARIPTLLESLTYQVYLGDAWTNPGKVEMIPLPQISIQARVTPPEYTRGKQSSRTTTGMHRITVLEGSQVELSVAGANRKPLQSVAIRFQSGGETVLRDLKPADGDAMEWQLPSTDYPPLDEVHNLVRFTVAATDLDGLQPAAASTGEIRVQADVPPDIVAATIHRVVLPTARPQFAFRVHDDFAVGRLRLQLQIEHQSGRNGTLEEAAAATETRWLNLTDEMYPISRPDLPHNGRYELDLAPYGLVKGDRIKLTFEATDYRGAAAGISVMSKPLYLEVSDKAGVMAAILEADHRTDEDLDEMIQTELGLGDVP